MTGGPELWIIIALVVVLVGGSRLPKIARNLGRAQGGMKKGLAESKAEVSKASKPETGTPAQA